MGEIYKRKVGDSSTYDFSFSNIHLVPFIIGIVLITVGLVDMIVLFTVPYMRIKDFKKKYPNETFENPNIPIIVIHFILHSLIISYGVILLLISLEIELNRPNLWILVPPIFIIFLWIIQMGLCFTFTKYFKSKMLINDLLQNINNEHPSNLIFLYTHDTYTRRSCSGGKKAKCRTTTYHCYSNIGISIPIQTNLIQNSFDFSEAPSLFYTNIIQEANMTEQLSNHFNRTLHSINSCDSRKKEIEYHPIIAGTHIVTKEKVPIGLSKGTRIASIIFGVGVYYELYSKSVPFINCIQKFHADVFKPINYDNLWSSFNCDKYGQCSSSNSKPTP